MRLMPVIVVSILTPCLSGCAPLSAVGMVGSTVVKTIRNHNERVAEEAPRWLAIAKANLDLGVEYMRRGNYENALTRFDRARLAAPDYAPTYSMLGLLYQSLGEDELAEANFRKSLALDATDSDTLNNYGQFLCKRGRFSEAEKVFLDAARNPLYGSPETPYANAGTCAYHNHDVARALGFFNRALALNPSLPVALISMSEIEYGNGNYVAADNYLERFRAVSAPTARSLWLGIRIKRQLGDEDAIAGYSLYLRANFPDSEEAMGLDKPVMPRQALVADQSGKTKQLPLLTDFGLFGEPKQLTDRQLLEGSEN